LASICIAHAHQLRGTFTGFVLCFDPQAAAFRLRPTLFFATFGAAVFCIGTLLGSFPNLFVGKLTAILTTEDLGGMIGRKSPIAGLE
jgi:hypothetical protein